MSGIYGIDPFFTYTYEDTNYNQSDSCFTEYHPECLMAYLNANHPKFTKIVQNTNYYEGIFSDLQFRGTVFVPKEDSIDENLLSNMDINFCKRFVDYHTMDGFFPKNVLMTSPFQKLQSKIKGQTITAAIYKMSPTEELYSIVLNQGSIVETFDIRLKNAFVHIITMPIPFDFLG